MEGLEKVLKEFQKYPDKVKKMVDIEFKDAARRVSGIAQRKAPVDQGQLRRTISIKGGDANYEVVVQNPIGVIQEFGTGKYALTKTAPEFQPYGSSFKGIKIPGVGTLSENILGWVKRKNIGGTRKGPALGRKRSRKQKESEQKSLAFVISRAIARDGVKPHPFLLDTFAAEKKLLMQRLIKLFRTN